MVIALFFIQAQKVIKRSVQAKKIIVFSIQVELGYKFILITIEAIEDNHIALNGSSPNKSTSSRLQRIIGNASVTIPKPWNLEGQGESAHTLVLTIKHRN
jgi:hypothetical protein